ncbi:DUF2288 family protein [Oscillatoria salina IIICB1]|nr:DUF2288 family protein [Oscillatoria salina IIICB1]NET88743.1 DUF2288 family protein [Kamptonema sp. SIO1D9]
MEDVKTKLAQDLANVEWGVLTPHAKRDAIIVVSKQLNIVDVGAAIAQDDVISVQHWISEQLIQKPDPEQLTSWNTNPSKQFSTLIVQPFVLVQEATPES